MTTRGARLVCEAHTHRLLRPAGRVGFALFLGSLVAGCAATSKPVSYSLDPFGGRDDRLGVLRKAFGESSITNSELVEGAWLLRVFCLPSFDHPVCLRVEYFPSKAPLLVLTLKIASGLGGYDLGRTVYCRQTVVPPIHSGWLRDVVSLIESPELPKEYEYDAVSPDSAEVVVELVREDSRRTFSRWNIGWELPRPGPSTGNREVDELHSSGNAVDQENDMRMPLYGLVAWACSVSGVEEFRIVVGSVQGGEQWEIQLNQMLRDLDVSLDRRDVRGGLSD